MKILRRPRVEEITGLSRSTIYDLMKKEKFPRPIKLGERSVGWLEADIFNWLKSRTHTSR